VADGTAQLRGADFERRIEQYLSLHGYACRRNAVLAGRSGGRHEVDVLAETSDGVTGYRLAVECKARNRPIDKEVVAKLAFVVADLGLHKGIVASLAGSHLGAEQSARELGIELWGPADLETRLGQVALAELAAGPAHRTGHGLPLACSSATAERLVRRARRGFLCGGRERIEWVRLAWVAHHVLALAVTGDEQGWFHRGPVKARWQWNLYEAVTGTFSGALPEAPALVEADLTLTVPPAVPAAKLVAAVRRAVARREEVVSPTARDRYAVRLEELGVPEGAHSVTVEEAGLAYWPFYLALLTTGTKARLVAVDGHLGVPSPTTGTLLTGTVGYVLKTLEV
jgi:Restriction endonuclease